MNVVEIIDTIKKIALYQNFIRSAFDGDVYDNWNNGTEVRYGSFNIGLQNITYSNNLVTYSLVMYYGDRLTQDKTNANQIYTDGVNALQSIINFLNKASNVEVSGDIIYTPFEQKFMDYLAGVYTTIELTTESQLGTCYDSLFTSWVLGMDLPAILS